ncbi:MAG: hypothetical protein ABIH92_00825 [Nanoarchaeota archaeon]
MCYDRGYKWFKTRGYSERQEENMNKILLGSMIVLVLMASFATVMAAGSQTQQNENARTQEHSQEHTQEHTQAQTQFLLCWRTHTQTQSLAKEHTQDQARNQGQSSSN